MNVVNYLNLAAKYAHSKNKNADRRTYLIGCIGIRNDGTKVFSRNSSAESPKPGAHAEHRILKKLNTDSIVFIARVSRFNKWKLAHPCPTCLMKLKANKVKRVYYTINPGEYGVIIPSKTSIPKRNIGKRVGEFDERRRKRGNEAWM